MSDWLKGNVGFAMVLLWIALTAYLYGGGPAPERLALVWIAGAALMVPLILSLMVVAPFALVGWACCKIRDR